MIALVQCTHSGPPPDRPPRSFGPCGVDLKVVDLKLVEARCAYGHDGDTVVAAVLRSIVHSSLTSPPPPFVTFFFFPLCALVIFGALQCSTWYLPKVKRARACARAGGGFLSLQTSRGVVLAERRCHPEEALYLPIFSHLLDCQ